ncbi:MAG TPA: type VI secretion system protein TssA [Telluria sp.]|nr:type VI secretion system protein TssA [Telluria sp.]
MFTIEELLAPVSEDHPCGEDLAFSSELDAIAKARQADDPSIEQGAWITTLKEADWKFVASGCAKLIKTRSKDLRLAVWLAEASAKTAGFRGLGDSLLVAAALCERYWDGLYPQPDESGFEQRVGNLCWIAMRAPQLAREVALTEGAATAFSLIDFESARSRGAEQEGPDVDAARRRSSAVFYKALLDDSAHCLAALAELERVTDVKLGADGPGFTAARAALQDVIHFITPFAGDQSATAATKVGAVAPAAPMPAATAGGPMQTRAQALAQLRAVAEFFRRTEPHSPVAYLADKAANWGEQPLHIWLRGVVKDEGVFAQLEEMLGVQAAQ